MEISVVSKTKSHRWNIIYVEVTNGFSDEKDAKGGGAGASDHQPLTGKQANESVEWHPRF
jgi:hypothetical protein